MSATPGTLRRELGLPGATLMGLGSILGTGIFVSIGIAAGIAGPAVVLAIIIAALVATCNALSSAQLAAAHPVSGGTYEYGYEFLSPAAGFLAGWMFLLAKSASAATAALGFSGYLLGVLGLDAGYRTLIAFCTTVLITTLVLLGVRRSSQANALIVCCTILALCAFALMALLGGPGDGILVNFTPFFSDESLGSNASNLLHATALMFVAYTGYGRIATMAEEVHDPRRTIPRAIVLTLVASAFLYILVSSAAVAAVGADFLRVATEATAAPLEAAARELDFPTVALLVTIGAATAMLGVLLNLVLGLSRVLLAMGRRKDFPGVFAQLDSRGTTPTWAVVAVGLLIASLTLVGSVRTTWSFSAFTVLIYYAITNAASIALPKERKLFARWIPWAGLVSCLGLAFWVDAKVWAAGVLLGVTGLCWHGVARRMRKE